MDDMGSSYIRTLVLVVQRGTLWPGYLTANEHMHLPYGLGVV
jgi:hypothetical protein